MLYIHAYSSQGFFKFFSKIIKRKTNSKCDHVSIEPLHKVTRSSLGIYEATFKEGVTKKTFHARNLLYSIKLPFDSESKEGIEFIKFLDSRVGFKYDLRAVLLGFFGAKIQDQDKDFCVEMGRYYFTHYLKCKTYIDDTNWSPKTIVTLANGYELGHYG